MKLARRPGLRVPRLFALPLRLTHRVVFAQPPPGFRLVHAGAAEAIRAGLFRLPERAVRRAHVFSKPEVDFGEIGWPVNRR